MSAISALAGGLPADDVLRSVSRASGDFVPEIERKVYYPYFWFHFRYRARTLLGSTAVRLSCLVDSRRRTGATTDGFEVETIDASPRTIIPSELDAAEAYRVAKRYSDYVVRSKRRALVAPEHEVLDEALVHKPYWIVRCSEPDGNGFRVLVDGMTGGFHPLG